MVKKRKLLAALAATVLASTSAFAVDFSTSITQGVTNSVTAVNQHVTGDINGTSLEYKTHRSDALGGVNGGNCGGKECRTGNDSLTIGVSVTATKTATVLDQLTTGSRNTNLTNCDVSVSVGGLSNSQGTRLANTTVNTTQVNDNVTTSVTGTVDVSALTDGQHGKFAGNDVGVDINGYSFRTDGDAIDVMKLADALTSGDLVVSVSGQDLNTDDMTGINVSWSVEDIKINDTSSTTTTGTTTTTTIYESLN
ncbi:hypothetical protein [Vibrio phage vB_VhaS-a]|nr:hypothetical protein [Vibrio phage vB_VhaS-a]